MLGLYDAPKSRIFLFFLLAFIAGVALRSFIAVPFFFIFLGFAAGVALAVVGVLGRRREIWVGGLLLVALAIGVFRFQQVQSAPPDLSLLYGRELQVRGVIVEEPEFTSKVQRFTFRIDEADYKMLGRPFLALVTLGLYPRYRLGDELAVNDTLKEPENFTEDFDYRAYLAKDDIYGTFFFPKVEKVGEDKGGRLVLVLSKIKHAFEEKIDRALPEPHAAFLKGLTLGERESLPEELVEDFKRTGVTHIIALSGYNITLVANFFIWTLLAFTLPFRFAFWIATAGIALFVLLTGASPSVTRAGVMGILILVARREGRLYSIRNALAFAGAAMIFHNPKILRFDAAFQLSFLATLGLVYLSPRVERWLDIVRSRAALLRGRMLPRRDPHFERRALFPFRRIFIETLSAQIAVLPLLIFLFGRVSLVSPVTNLLVIVAVPHSMILGFLTGALGFVWDPLSQISAGVNWIFLEYKIRVIELFARLPASSVKLGRWAAIPIIFLYAYVGLKWLRDGKDTPKS